MDFKLRIWRQRNNDSKGGFVDYEVEDISSDLTFLEMLDILNENLIRSGHQPVEFDSDCREGICGTCGFVIDGVAHGPTTRTTVCQLYMRHFNDGDQIVIEPFRASSFPIIKDLVVNRNSLDTIVASGAYISVRTGNAPDANSILVPKPNAEEALDAAACIGCGACVAACPNASAYLFAGAKINHYKVLPQGDPERKERVVNIVNKMDEEGFGNCSNHAECEAVCPKGISILNIAVLRKEYIRSMLT